MAQNKPKKTVDSKDLVQDKKFTEVVTIMADTPPATNKEIVKRNKKRQK